LSVFITLFLPGQKANNTSIWVYISLLFNLIDTCWNYGLLRW